MHATPQQSDLPRKTNGLYSSNLCRSSKWFVIHLNVARMARCFRSIHQALIEVADNATGASNVIESLSIENHRLHQIVQEQNRKIADLSTHNIQLKRRCKLYAQRYNAPSQSVAVSTVIGTATAQKCAVCARLSRLDEIARIANQKTEDEARNGSQKSSYN